MSSSKYLCTIISSGLLFENVQYLCTKMRCLPQKAMFRYYLPLTQIRLISAPNFITDHQIKHNIDLQNQAIKFIPVLPTIPQMQSFLK